MGWFGHGLYDGDGTLSVQLDLLEKSGFKKGVTFATGEKGDVLEFDENSKLDVSVVKQVFDRFEKVGPKVFNTYLLDPKTDFNQLKNRREDFDESLIELTMVADFFMKQKAEMPKNLKKAAIKATAFLIDSEHTKDFKSPTARKKVLRGFLEELNSFKPELKFSSKAKPIKEKTQTPVDILGGMKLPRRNAGM